jgi:hypothetical protein
MSAIKNVFSAKGLSWPNIKWIPIDDVIIKAKSKVYIIKIFDALKARFYWEISYIIIHILPIFPEIILIDSTHLFNSSIESIIIVSNPALNPSFLCSSIILKNLPTLLTTVANPTQARLVTNVFEIKLKIANRIVISIVI